MGEIPIGYPTPPQPPSKRDADEIAWQDISDMKLAGLVAGEKWTNSLGMEFVTIPAGSFRMGDLSGQGHADEKPVREVTIRQPFAMMTTEVTQGQWQAVMDSNPSRFTVCGSDCPVEQVSWDDIQQFIQKLKAKTGESYRLPSEAEWEYAARAGTQTEFAFGNQITTEQANFDGNDTFNDSPKGAYRQSTVVVKSFKPNVWGLYDMHGNVHEWVEDVEHSSYDVHSGTGSAVVFGASAYRGLRGGSWGSSPVNLRAASRYSEPASYRFDGGGFRLVQGR